MDKQRVILLSSIQGSPRFMKQFYQDTIALFIKFDRPNLFVTFTYNPKWREITEHLLPDEQSINRSDLITRVFRLKLKTLMHDIMKEKVLGTLFFLSPP